MSRNGELCLKKVIISYSPSHGDPNVRQFLSLFLPAFHRQYPSVTFDLRPRHWPETSITGVYRDGSERAYAVRGLSAMGISTRVHRLVNDANDSNVPFGATHRHYQRRSVQGVWGPWLWQFEGARARKPAPAWDRTLSPREWDYYAGQYGAQMKAEEEAIADRVRRHTELPDASTREVQRRWRAHVLPRLQTDLEHNIGHWKRRHARGAPSESPPVTLNEYRLFSVPDPSALGQDAVNMLRRRESRYAEEWWRQRKEQLKPPE